MKNRYLILLLLIFSFSSYSKTSDEKLVQKEASLRSKVYKSPKHLYHNFTLAEFYRKTNRCRKALRYYKKNIYNHSTYLTPVLLGMAKCYIKLGKRERSYHVLNYLLTHDISEKTRKKAMNILGYTANTVRGILPKKGKRIKSTAKNSLPKTPSTPTPTSLPTKKEVANRAYYTFIPYIALLKYGGTTSKSDGFIKGAYLSRTHNYDTLELFAETTDINYLTDYNLLPLSQLNVGLFYSFFSSYTIKHRLGFHHIFTTDPTSNGANMFNYSFQSFPELDEKYSAEFYYTSFPEYESGTGLTVMQLSPSYTSFSTDWDFTFRANVIKTSTPVILEETQAVRGKNRTQSTSLFFSFELELAYKMASSKLEYRLVLGDRIFPVENAGLNLYNTTDIYNMGHYFSYTLTISKDLFIVGKYSQSAFTQVGAEQNGSSNAISALLGINF